MVEEPPVSGITNTMVGLKGATPAVARLAVGARVHRCWTGLITLL